MEDKFTPVESDVTIRIPVTFDYRGGRASEVKNKVVAVIVSLVIAIGGTILLLKNNDMSLILKFIIIPSIWYILLVFNRYFVFKEIYFSDLYEDMLETDKKLNINTIWSIFEIEQNYPYICYFSNGYKGIFVRMERDTITGKDNSAQYQHYEAVGQAYNLAHQLNMNIVNIDYMESIGNDTRLDKLYQDLVDVHNEDMKEMLIDIYDNLREQMQDVYSSTDVYLFLTRDTYGSFIYNVQQVVGKMLGGNYLSYSILDRIGIGNICSALFNLEEFSVIQACNNIYDDTVTGIRPISIIHNGEETILNKTTEEIAELRKAREQTIQDMKAEKKRRKMKQENTFIQSDEEIDFFGSDDNNTFGQK